MHLRWIIFIIQCKWKCAFKFKSNKWEKKKHRRAPVIFYGNSECMVHVPFSFSSAGVGRTGAYIVIDSMLERIKHEKTVDIYGHVTCLRAQRNYMVQTEEQYIFIHEALYEAVASGTTEVHARNLYAHIQKLTSLEPGETITGMENEFKVREGAIYLYLSAEVMGSLNLMNIVCTVNRISSIAVLLGRNSKLWCIGSYSRLVIRGSWVRIPLGAHAPRQGISSTVVSLDPGVVNGYPAGIYSFNTLSAESGCMRANNGVIMQPWMHRDAVWKCEALYMYSELTLLLV